MKKFFLTSAAVFGLATAVAAEPVNYVLDASHSQIVFSYNHLGFSTTTGMFSGFDGAISFDAENPAASSVTVEVKADSLITGWNERDAHFLSDDFFGAGAAPLITFASTGIEVTGENTGLITGDLTVNGITNPVMLCPSLSRHHRRG
ncbi:MAG: polyisoprenoid-binding protein [Marivivens sp.]|nr:polyisoprenoid-binding protein [Marivivens sp.]